MTGAVNTGEQGPAGHKTGCEIGQNGVRPESIHNGARKGQNEAEAPMGSEQDQNGPERVQNRSIRRQNEALNWPEWRQIRVPKIHKKMSRVLV